MNVVSDIRYSVRLALRYWRTGTPQENIRKAFGMIRDNLQVGDTMPMALGRLEITAIRTRYRP